jgi:hypothetical protein
MFNTGASSADVAVGDINNDGVADVVTATTAGGIEIDLGNATGPLIKRLRLRR